MEREIGALGTYRMRAYCALALGYVHSLCNRDLSLLARAISRGIEISAMNLSP